jgi:hypothetical protein
LNNPDSGGPTGRRPLAQGNALGTTAGLQSVYDPGRDRRDSPAGESAPSNQLQPLVEPQLLHL